MAETMAKRDPNCMMGIKEVMNRAREPAVKEGLEYVMCPLDFCYIFRVFLATLTPNPELKGTIARVGHVHA